MKQFIFSINRVTFLIQRKSAKAEINIKVIVKVKEDEKKLFAFYVKNSDELSFIAEQLYMISNILFVDEVKKLN